MVQCNTHVEPRFDINALDPEQPFELDHVNSPHLAKHPGCDPELLYSIWASERRFYPAAHGPADWFLVAETGGIVYLATLMKAEHAGPDKCRPIGLMKAPNWIADLYLSDVY